MRQEARGRGVSDAILDAALCGKDGPLRKVIELDRRQPEFVDTFWNYLDRRVTDYRIDAGQQILVEHGELLDSLEKRYGIPATLLVAFWGLETNYGNFLGNYPTACALATLAWDGRRGAFFRRELLAALDILEAGHVKPDAMRGSWAGAVGQMQFMPSNFLRYAIDADGDGRKDLWASTADALTSAAHFLNTLGWRDGELWGREVRLPDGFDFRLAGGEKDLGHWTRLGLTLTDGSPLPNERSAAALLLPQGSHGPAFLIERNFNVIMSWNRSQHYALAVAHLSDRLAGLPPFNLGRNADNRPMHRVQMAELQRRLNHLGHDAGPVDGVLGSRTRQALREYQAKRNLVADGHPSVAILERLRLDSADLAIQQQEAEPAAANPT